MEIKADPIQNPAIKITNCLYHNFTSFPRKSDLYTCTIVEINGDQSVMSTHLPEMSNDDVQIVRLMRIKNCQRIPKGLKQIFPNFEILIISDCKMTEIEREDLKELEGLKDFIVEHTQISHLSSEVFKDLRDLEVIMFYHTNLTTIESNIFDDIQHLRAVYLIENPSINAVYVNAIDLSLPEKFGPHTKVPSITEFKKIITGCSPCDSVCTDLKKLLSNEEFKDFTVTIKESCYHGIDCSEKCCNEVIKVHKFLLIARSPVLAEMIHQNPDARNLNLIDIPGYAFKKVIDFFYNGVISNIQSDPYLKMKDVYAVADKLGLKELRRIARNEMIKQENCESDKSMDGESSKRLKLNSKGQMTRSLDYGCKCRSSGDQIVSMGMSMNHAMRRRSENFRQFKNENSQNQDLRIQDENFQKTEVLDSGLEIFDDYFDIQNDVNGYKKQSPENFKDLTKKIQNFNIKVQNSDTSHESPPKKIPRPLPENLNYKNANRSSMIYYAPDDLNDAGLHDFVKIEIEDQYEIINDFYDEVCSLEGNSQDNKL